MTGEPRTLPAPPRPVRLGIIGTGLAVEHLHWPALRRLSERFHIVAFANRGRTGAERFASYSGALMADYYADYHDLLRRDDVEAVLIALPIPLLLPATRAALATGKHVLCEKPAGADPAEAATFLALAAAHPDHVLLIAENCFYRDDIRLARALLDAGTIGRVHLAAWRHISPLVPAPGAFAGTPWRHAPAYRGGIHLDAGVHHIAQLRLLVGDIARVSGEVGYANPFTSGPSDLTLALRFVNGAIGHYTAAYPGVALPRETSELRLYGDGGVMTVAAGRLHVARPGATAEEHRVDGADGGFYNEFLNFYEAVVHGAPGVSTVAQNVRNARVIFAALDAAETGRAVTPNDGPEASLPLWQPAGARDLFDGLPVRLVTQRQQA